VDFSASRPCRLNSGDNHSHTLNRFLGWQLDVKENSQLHILTELLSLPLYQNI
jgi:hypothetical protein